MSATRIIECGEHAMKSSAQVLRLQWHKPKIVDFGIHVPPKKNTWRTFFKIVGEQVATHQSFPVVFPKVRIFSEHKAKLNRARVARCSKNKQHRHPTKKCLDPVSFYNLPLPDSAVNQVILKLKIEKGEGSMSERERHEMLVSVLADFVIKAIKNNA
jgi:hypothetical protein